MAVVTGASSGIGKAVAEKLVEHGITVAGLARRVERITELSNTLKGKKGKLHGYKIDLTNLDEIAPTIQKISQDLGPIHILVNNAGLLKAGNILSAPDSDLKTILDTNVLAVAITTREVVKNQKANNVKGHIINVNSVLGHRVLDSPFLSLYPASKFAVTALTETIRLEINREKLPIKITSLSPGYVKTEFAQAAFGKETAQKFESARAGLVPEDVAEAALYVLATPDHVNVKELTLSVQGSDS